MAGKDKKQENDIEDAPVKEKKPLSPKVKLIIIIAAALLVVLAAVGGTLYMLGLFEGDGTEDAQEEDVVAEASSEDSDEGAVDNKPAAAMYFPIVPAFVVNIPDKGKQRYLKVELTVLTRDTEVFNALQVHLPLINNRLVMLFAGEVYQELQTPEGKELLRQKTLEALQGVMEQELGKTGIEEVLFTDFVMQ